MVDGRLLLQLDDQALKAELGIGPLGHRVALLQGVEELAAGTSAFAAVICRRFAAARRRSERMRRGGGVISCGSPRTGATGGSRGGSRPASPGGVVGWESAAGAAGPKRPRSAPNLRARVPPIGGGGLPGDAFLGPASGKVTVQEQRAKLLFELSRAQVRFLRALAHAWPGVVAKAAHCRANTTQAPPQST